MSDRDFFREVNEAVRQDQYRALWDKYGLYVLALAVLLVAGVAGYNAWTFWRQSERAICRRRVHAGRYPCRERRSQG